MSRTVEIYLWITFSTIVSCWSGIYIVENEISKACNKEMYFKMRIKDVTIVCNTVENIKNGIK